MPSRPWIVSVFFVLLSVAPGRSLAVDRDVAGDGVVRSEFVFESAPFAQCHASTIVSTPSGLVTAWFAGTKEGHPDVGIWLSRHDGKTWSKPVEVANGAQSATERFPCWNPVLFRWPPDPAATDASGRSSLMLYYKVGPSPSRWWGMAMASEDDGKTWSPPVRLADGILGPIKNKPILLKDGTALSGSSTEDNGWRVHVERSTDRGRRWSASDPLNDGQSIGAIQPALLVYGDRIQMLCRSRQSAIVESWSEDGGKSWSPMTATSLPNNNSGLDATTLGDGRALLVYNHTTKGRSPLNVAVSRDGKEWHAALALESEPGEYSYPAVIASGDGLAHLVYTWKRLRVKHVVIDPARLTLRPIEKGVWPAGHGMASLERQP